MDNGFVLAGIRPLPAPRYEKETWYKGRPVISFCLFFLIAAGCLFCEAFIPKDPTFMDFYHANTAPNSEFWFGTDTMGRDIFSMIWYGGRISLLIGLSGAGISAFIGILLGAVSGLGPEWLDGLLMRFTELFLSIPNLLLVLLLQAFLGEADVWSLSFVIGVTSWTNIAKVVRTEVRQLRGCEYVIAARCAGAGFFRIVFIHLLPNFFASILFMAVMNIRSAVSAEAALSFLGLGLPLEVISWGSMLSLSEQAFLSGLWWLILIPGVFLVMTLLCITNIGNYIRKGKSQTVSPQSLHLR